MGINLRRFRPDFARRRPGRHVGTRAGFASRLVPGPRNDASMLVDSGVSSFAFVP